MQRYKKLSDTEQYDQFFKEFVHSKRVPIFRVLIRLIFVAENELVQLY